VGAAAGASPLQCMLRLPLPLQTEHARMLAAEFGPPSGNDIATYNIILFSSIGLVFIFYFSIMALVNMECEGDSLLYSKSKGD